MGFAPLLIVKKCVTVEVGGGFSSAEQFREGALISGFPIKAVGINFVRHFYDHGDQSPRRLAAVEWTLQRPSIDREIIQALGGQAAASLALAQMHALIDGMQDDEIIGRSCVAYCFSAQHKIWAVNCILDHDRKWIIGAAEVPHEYLQWSIGTIFFALLNMEHSSNPHKAVVRHEGCHP